MKNYVRVNQSKITTVDRGSNLKNSETTITATKHAESLSESLLYHSRTPKIPDENPGQDKNILYYIIYDQYIKRNLDHACFCFMTRADMK